MAGSEARNGTGPESARKEADTGERGKGGYVVIAVSPETYKGGEQIRRALTKQGYITDIMQPPDDTPDALRAWFNEGEKPVGYIDIACGSLADEQLGEQAGLVTARIEAALEQGVPTVVAPGGMDIVHWASRDAVPAKYQRRKLLPRGASQMLMRTDVTDNASLGRALAELLNRFPHGLGVCLPLRGLSSLSAPGEPFSSRETDMALFGNLITHLRREIKLYEANYNINDPEFADLCIAALQEVSPKHPA